MSNWLELTKKVKNIKGDFAEFGVHKGHSFIKLLGEALKQNKQAHAIDSFRGMAEPTEKDFDIKGHTEYPKGKFDVGGADYVIQRLKHLGYTKDKDYYIWEGYIPEVFGIISDYVKFSFARIDLDHHRPTILTLNWLWWRLITGGIVLCDDYFPRRKFLASPAIKEFLAEHRRDVRIGGVLQKQIWFKKAI